MKNCFMKTLLFCCSFIIFSCICFASEKMCCTNCSFIGIVVDAATGKPMADVVIIAKGAALIKEQKVVTDEEGKYNIPSLPYGTYTLRFQKDNYKPLEKKNLIVKKNSAKLDVELLLQENKGEDHHNWLLKVDFM